MNPMQFLGASLITIGATNLWGVAAGLLAAGAAAFYVTHTAK